MNISTFIDFLAVYIPRATHGQGSESAFAPGGNIFYWVVIVGSILASWYVQHMLQRRFSEYSQMAMPVSGKEVAERMLKENNITDVSVISTPGKLTDHYNPVDKTVNLSEGVYNSYSVAAAAVAAHEVGHAVQHAQAYKWLGLRSKLVPVVQLSSKLVMWVIIFGIILMVMSDNRVVLGVGVGLLAMTTIFAFVTLPVEFNASSRALAWMSRSNIGGYIERDKAQNALFWAAMTYVVAALSSLAMLMHYAAIFLGGRRD